MAQLIRTPKKLDLVLCEIHHPSIHGKTDESATNIESHYLVFDRYDWEIGASLSDEYDENEDEDDYDLSTVNIAEMIDTMNRFYYQGAHILRLSFPPHPTVRNYQRIVTREGYIRPEIAECIELPTMETIAILKTFWLRIIQRTWKKIFNKIQQVRNNRTQISSLLFRELHGKWPQNCCYLPTLRGMLKGL